MTAHPHAELIKRFAEDAQYSDAPWERWEVMMLGEWCVLDEMPTWDIECNYRRRFSPPELFPPNPGERYFIPAPDKDEWIREYTWGNDRQDRRYLELGLVYLNKEDAIGKAREWVEK